MSKFKAKERKKIKKNKKTRQIQQKVKMPLRPEIFLQLKMSWVGNKLNRVPNHTTEQGSV